MFKNISISMTQNGSPIENALAEGLKRIVKSKFFPRKGDTEDINGAIKAHDLSTLTQCALSLQDNVVVPMKLRKKWVINA